MGQKALVLNKHMTFDYVCFKSTTYFTPFLSLTPVSGNPESVRLESTPESTPAFRDPESESMNPTPGFSGVSPSLELVNVTRRCCECCQFAVLPDGF